MYRFGWLSSTSRIFKRYCCLSHCARGDHTAGPRDVFSSRNWIPTASVTSPITPPSASTSRTRWPLAMPPTAGLQDICAIRSTLSVNNAVFKPMRAQAIAASHPACPAPTTTTSYCYVKDILYVYCIGRIFVAHTFTRANQYLAEGGRVHVTGSVSAASLRSGGPDDSMTH